MFAHDADGPRSTVDDHVEGRSEDECESKSGKNRMEEKRKEYVWFGSGRVGVELGTSRADDE